jgi:hypothetical protein
MPHWNSETLKVEGTETGSNKVIRKEDWVPALIGERKGLQHWKGIVECLKQPRVFQRPATDENIV